MTTLLDLQQYLSLIAVSACAVLLLFIASADSAEPPSLSAEGAQSVEQLTPISLETVYFDSDSLDLNAAARKTIRHNALKLKKYPETKLQLIGHTDERGSDEYSLAIGEGRAKRVMAYLVSIGFDPGRITVVSYGNGAPVDARHTRQARAKNRRVEFMIVR